MKALFFLLLTFGAIVVCNITIVAGNTESQTLTANPYLICEPVLESIDNLLSAILKLYRSSIIALRKFILEELELARNSSSQGIIGGKFKWNLWKDQKYQYGGSLQEMIIYMQKEIMDAETKLEFVIKFLNGLVDGTITPPQQLPAETVKIICHIWSGLRFSINKLNQDADTFRSYVVARIDSLKNRFGEGSFEFHAMMKIVYHEVDTMSIRWVKIVGLPFRKALTLPRASYYVVDLETFYAEWPKFLNLNPKSTIVEYLIQSKSLANTIHNAAQVHFFLSVSMRLQSNTWAYMNLIFQDASNTSRFVDHGWKRIDSYLRSSLNLIQLQIQAQNYEQADAEMQTVRSQAESDIKMLMDFTETPYRRIHNALHSDCFETHATDSRYTGSFQNLLSYLAENGFSISWDKNEFVSIRERVTVVADTSDTGAALTYYSKSTFRGMANENKSGNDEKYLQSPSVYYLILHDQVLRDIISIYYNLLNNLRSFFPPDEVLKVVLLNLREDAILFAQAYQYLRLYVSESGLLIDWIHLETVEEYMNFLERLDIDVLHRLDIFSYRVLSTFMRVLDYMESVNSALQSPTDTGGTLPAETAAPKDLKQDGLAKENSRGLNKQPLGPIAENPVLGSDNVPLQTTINEKAAESIPVEGTVNADLSNGLLKITTRDLTDQKGVPITDNSVLENNNSVSSLKNIQMPRLMLIEHGKIKPYLFKPSGIQSKVPPQTTINEKPAESIPAEGIVNAGPSQGGTFSTGTPQAINPSPTVTPTRRHLDDAESGKKPYLPIQGTSKYVQPAAITPGVEEPQNISDAAIPKSTVADDNLITQNPGVTMPTTPRGLNEDNFGKREGMPGLRSQTDTYSSPFENSNPIKAIDTIIEDNGVVPGSTNEKVTIPMSPAAETFISPPRSSNAEYFGKREGMPKLFTSSKPSINNVEPSQIQATDDTTGGKMEAAGPTNGEIVPGVESVLSSPRGTNGDNFGKREGMPGLGSQTNTYSSPFENANPIRAIDTIVEDNGVVPGSTNEKVTIPMSPAAETFISPPRSSNAEYFGKREGMPKLFTSSKPSINNVEPNQIQATDDTTGGKMEVAGPTNEEIVPDVKSVPSSPRGTNGDNFGKRPGFTDSHSPTTIEKPDQISETVNTNEGNEEVLGSTNERVIPMLPTSEIFASSRSSNAENFGKREGMPDFFSLSKPSPNTVNPSHIQATDEKIGEDIKDAGPVNEEIDLIDQSVTASQRGINGDNLGKREGMADIYPRTKNYLPTKVQNPDQMLETNNTNGSDGEFQESTIEEITPKAPVASNMNGEHFGKREGISDIFTPATANPHSNNSKIRATEDLNGENLEAAGLTGEETISKTPPVATFIPFQSSDGENFGKREGMRSLFPQPAVNSSNNNKPSQILSDGTPEVFNPTTDKGIIEETTPIIQSKTPVVDNLATESGTGREVFPELQNGTPEVFKPTTDKGIIEETTPIVQSKTPVVDNLATESGTGREVFPELQNGTPEVFKPTTDKGIIEETTPIVQSKTPVVDNLATESGTGRGVFPELQNGTPEVSPSNNEIPEGEGSSALKQEEIDAALDLLSSVYESIDTDGNGKADVLLLGDTGFTHTEGDMSIEGVLPVDLNGDGSPDTIGTLTSKQKIIEDKGVVVLGDLNPNDGLRTNTIIETTKTTEKANTVLNIVLGTTEQQQL